MSGSHLVDQTTEAVPNLPGTHPPAEDPAASLRTAALLTLKSKRRKLTATTTVPHIARSLAAQPSIELDYGSEEPSGTASSEVSGATVQPAKTVAAPSESMDVDDSQAREEGEISDSEMAPPTPKLKPNLTFNKVVEQGKAAAQTPPQKPKVEPISPTLSSVPSRPSVFASPALVPALASAHVDENQVRPGLALTQAQFDAAKDIVLDLLGWGVRPEYLVDCGLSREIIFYVFVELNLRLPTNLDVTGLLPYTPSTAPTSPSAPPRPQQTEPVSSLSAAAAPFVPSTSNANESAALSPSLSDMEQQRKAELLARKAVLASRKLRPQKSSSVSLPSTSPVVSTSSTIDIVPTKTVDDFLKSIEPAAPSTSTTGATTSTSTASASMRSSRAVYMDRMNVDEVPGLSGGPTTDYTPLPRPVPSALSAKVSGIGERMPPSATSSTSNRSLAAPPSTSAIGNGDLSYGNDDDMGVVPGPSQSRLAWEDAQSTSVRRGTKRPVAADFVDLEPGSSRSGVRTDNYRPPVRRRTTGFAGLTQRRCVIDLSDTEDEQEEATLLISVVSSRTDSRGPIASTPEASVAPTPCVDSPVTPLINPAALLEKEEQIRRMRELIAQREQNRLKKIALASRGTALSSNTQTNGSASVKQEEDDAVSARSLHLSRSSSSSTPEVSSGRLSESRDERTVLSSLVYRGTNGDGTVSLPDSESPTSPTTPIEVKALEHSVTGDEGKSLDNTSSPAVLHPHRSSLSLLPLNLRFPIPTILGFLRARNVGWHAW
ncbi:hypothetical protein BD311DRAFT_845701 [Dichomitus squalens]|uniref:Uncharacterized protein n=1 Tax=Dichomitus squalens TaxID=114155 RepID=A0A4Q9MI31_9APHY|nr:hypothetical protein BD311DRAFT_845701 [Dichomitus squalens]